MDNDYTPKVGYTTETELEWRQRLDHRLNNIERLLFHIRDSVSQGRPIMAAGTTYTERIFIGSEE